MTFVAARFTQFEAAGRSDLRMMFYQIVEKSSSSRVRPQEQAITMADSRSRFATTFAR